MCVHVYFVVSSRWKALVEKAIEHYLSLKKNEFIVNAFKKGSGWGVKSIAVA